MEKALKILFSIIISMILLHSSSSSTILTAYAQPDFHYIFLDWPASQCNTKKGCCQSNTAKGSRDFIIAGFQPFYFNGTIPEYCNNVSHLDMSKISHLVSRLQVHWPSLSCPTSKAEKLWSNEWQKYGTCSESTLNQHDYFKQALLLRNSANLLKGLSKSGINPNGSSYDADSFSNAIANAVLHYPGISCSRDKSGESQLNRVILCSGPDGKSFVECPSIPNHLLNICANAVKFPHI